MVITMMNKKCLGECIECCLHFLERGGSVVDVVYMAQVGFNLDLTHHFGRAHRGQKRQ